jgi:tRNA(Ile)-lysidine synthase
MFSYLQLNPFFQKYRFSSYWIAYSGGLDSHVLLHAMATLHEQNQDIPMQVVHVHHGLSPNADLWEKHCVTACEHLSLPYKVFRIDAKPLKGMSKEAFAREERYEIFKDILKQNEGLLLAHHQDDQAETVMLQLLRGAGPKGLSAMPELKPLGKGYLLRPLLPFTRDQLKKYAVHYGLKWIDDESNFDVSFDRNFIRHEVLPFVKKRWPSVNKLLSRVALNCQAYVAICDDALYQELSQILSDDHKTLSLAKLRALSENKRNQLIRYWLLTRHLPLPSRQKLDEFNKVFLTAKEDKRPYLKWREVEVRRFRDKLYFERPLLQHDPTQIIPWDILENPKLILPNELGILEASKSKKGGFKLPPHGHGSIRFRQGGERCKPLGRKETHLLKKLWQEWGIPPWLRDRIPLLYFEETLASVVGYTICVPFVTEEDGWEVQWRTIEDI